MTHIEIENLASDYLATLLSPASKGEFEAHLEHCAECRELVEGVRQALELCRSAEDLEPAPWLISKILLATVGERKPTVREQLAALLRGAIQPRVAYALAMMIFSFSIIVNAAGINLRHLTFEDLNPFTWVNRARRTGHRLYGRAEKFYYDLRVVYEIESRFRRLRAEPQQEQNETPKPESTPGGSTDRNRSGEAQLASIPTLSPHPDGVSIALVSVSTGHGGGVAARSSSR